VMVNVMNNCSHTGAATNWMLVLSRKDTGSKRWYSPTRATG
jgi:hypothetical protein